ncbi:MAG: hypothetical protein IJC29_04545, partial [Clostridia bacterium]|nr:hypothetical protein [Clostridia bacterium]
AQAWLPVTGELSETEEGYEGRCGNYRVNLRRGDKGNGVTLTAEDSSLSWEYVGKMYRGAKRNRAAKRAQSVRCGTKNRDGAETVVYGKIDADLDMEYSVLGGGVKENLTILAPAATYAWGFRMQAQGLTPTLSPDAKEIVWQNEQGETALTVPPAFMLDAKGAFCDNVVYALDKQEDGTYFLTVRADSTWLNDPTRAFPVILDPQVVTNTDNNKYLEPSPYYYNLETGAVGVVKKESIIKVGVEDGKQWECHFNINKSGIELPPLLYSSILKIKTLSSPGTSVYIQGYEYYLDGIYYDPIQTVRKTYTATVDGDGYLTIDITGILLAANGDFTLRIFSDQKETVLLNIGANADFYLTLDCLEDKEIPAVEQTFALTDNALAIIDLATGEKTTIIEDVRAENSVMDIPVCHVLRPGKGTGALGKDFRLSLEERVTVINDQSGTTLYLHTDGTGTVQKFCEYFYTVSGSGEKTYLNKTLVAIDPDGSMHDAQGNKVEVEYISTTGLELMTQPEGLAGSEVLETRADEQKQLEEQIKSYESIFEDYLIVDPKNFIG